MGDMSFEEYVWGVYEQEMAKRNDGDYEVNHTQMQKLIDAYEFFSGVAEECGGSIDKVELRPKEINGGFTAYFTLFYIHHEKIERFCEVVSWASAMSIDSTLDNEVCMSFTIPNIFKRTK